MSVLDGEKNKNILILTTSSKPALILMRKYVSKGCISYKKKTHKKTKQKKQKKKTKKKKQKTKNKNKKQKKNNNKQNILQGTYDHQVDVFLRLKYT